MRVFQTDHPSHAHLVVQVVRVPAMADLLVYRNDGAGSVSHGEGVWTFTRERQNANLAVHLSDSGARAQLRIAYVSSPTLSGWVHRKHRLKGRLRSHHFQPAH